jgi:hypothetical protein
VLLQIPKFRSDAHEFFIVLPNLNYGQNGVEYMEESPTQKTSEKATQKATQKGYPKGYPKDYPKGRG